MTIAEQIKKAHIERYEHGGGRMWYEDEKGSRHLIADFYGDGEAREYILGVLQAARPCHNCGSSVRPTGCHICGFPIDDPTASDTEGEPK